MTQSSWPTRWKPKSPKPTDPLRRAALRKTMAKKRVPDDVLRYVLPVPSQGVIRRAYLAWRAQQTPPIPERCDQEQCRFHTQPPIWNGKRFKFILDHRKGVRADNRPDSLQLLCPICNAQQPTHGGGNKGQVEMYPGGFMQRVNSKREFVMPAETGHYRLQ
jgi:hypothetical protein